ncbi:holo-ACP synthase [Brevibacterium casei]|uniref:Holo-[acyl-carrier-protein] synthase n=2 Tax=Brevibacterium casei TaxID=33889 RepID=A0A2H1K3Z3_9MICO|nr:4'-phosphopantetheinyl transferase superfamily protein [Brevibacterium casei]MCT1548980.1 4'-phosphopantetheinyl transferase superfamily protein [Brevibacterium casei]MCT1558953.1 4'-phosphopantetheinyl transferase superfamily protein [Brevibacterium casei]MCT2207190.1 4'-phosphopantetheinyl transferase superfamily protein [Brevibacterium casei]QPR38054.1 4'-phosphopantetheinyl transferase superfamily protein [Brevibacterium casei]QPR45343.1 4'-phosphopantetheinyl transferase superfamily pr
MNASLLRVGVDMVNIRELANMLETSETTFLDSCWTEAEQTYCAGSVPRLAARWAAKEAAMKALGHGLGEVDPLDIEVQAVEGEAPTLHLRASAAAYAAEAEINSLALSLTHETDFALAFVVALGAGAISESPAQTAVRLAVTDGFPTREPGSTTTPLVTP